MNVKQKKDIVFDELNKLDSITAYYEPMQISIDDKAKRRELAELLTDAFLFFFATYEVHDKFNRLLDKAKYEQLLADKIKDAVTKVTGIDSYLSKHINELSKDVVETTFKNIKVKPGNSPETQNSTTFPKFIFYSNSDIPALLADVEAGSSISPKLVDDPASLNKAEDDDTDDDELENIGEKDNKDEDNDKSYWLSYGRAENIGKSETNTILNYADYVTAKELGATKKTWLTMLDNKVRTTHDEIEGQTIGIDEYFNVGNSVMLFPHDLSMSPEPKEYINCRCAVIYS